MSEHKDQNNNPVRVGDPVSFVKVTPKNGGYSFRSMEGKVLRFDNWGRAVVKLKNGRAAPVAIENLRRADLGPSELTEAALKGAKAYGDR